MCCQGKGDFSFTDLDRDTGDCCALRFDNKLAVCEVEESEGKKNKRECCRDYPNDEWCERELKEKGLWEAWLTH